MNVPTPNSRCTVQDHTVYPTITANVRQRKLPEIEHTKWRNDLALAPGRQQQSKFVIILINIYWVAADQACKKLGCCRRDTSFCSTSRGYGCIYSTRSHDCSLSNVLVVDLALSQTHPCKWCIPSPALDHLRIWIILYIKFHTSPEETKDAQYTQGSGL